MKLAKAVAEQLTTILRSCPLFPLSRSKTTQCTRNCL